MIKELLDKGVIVKSTSSYSTLIVLARKKDGSFFMCIDHRTLNDITIKNKFLMPIIDNLMDELQGARFF